MKLEIHKIFRNGYLRSKIYLAVAKLKGTDYHIDDRIPISYLLRLAMSKTVSLFYGMIRLRTLQIVFVHPSSKIKCSSCLSFGKHLMVGEKCYIDALSQNGLRFGDNVSIGYATHIELTGSLKLLGKGMTVGNNVGLGSHGHYGSGAGILKIGDDTICGNYVSIHPENHITQNLDIPIREQGVYSKGGVKIGRGCWIGAKVTILDGTEIGDGCIVAAGAVVTGKFPDYSIIGGVPAKVLKMRK